MKKVFLRKVFIMLLTVTLVATTFPVHYASTSSNPIQLVVNGIGIEADVPPQLVDNRTMVPVRWVAEALGAKVQWDADVQAVFVNSTPTSKIENKNEIQLVVNNEVIQPDVPPINKQGRLLVPVRWVSEALGAQVEWSTADWSVYVSTLDELELFQEEVGSDVYEALLATGIIADEEMLRSDQPVKRVELLAWINQALGFDEGLKYHNLGVLGPIWEVSTNDRHAHVIRSTQAAGYANHYDTIQPETDITRHEAAVLIANALDLSEQSELVNDLTDANTIPSESRGAVGAVLSEGFMKPREGEAFSPQETLTRAEAQLIKDRLVAVHDEEVYVNIIHADAATEDVVLLTLDSTFSAIRASDLQLQAALGEFARKRPELDAELNFEPLYTLQNRFGNTVVVVKLENKLEADGTIDLVALDLVERHDRRVFPYATRGPNFTVGDLNVDMQQADYLISWQMDHGGWSKDMDDKYNRMWDGQEPRSIQTNQGVELGSIDNNGATTEEIDFMAYIYYQTGEERFKESFLRGIEFLLNMQFETGGFPQVYPERGNYSDLATFNDGAIIKAMEILKQSLERTYPYNSDLLDKEMYARVQDAYDRGLDFIVNSQIEVDGKQTAWPQQLDPYTYEPMLGRSYEHPSISAAESAGIVDFLQSIEHPSEEVQQAILYAFEWFDEVKMEDVLYAPGGVRGEYFLDTSDRPELGHQTWYRFYEIGTNRGIFSDRDGVIKYDITEIGTERRHGYMWAGNWMLMQLNNAKSVGKFEDRIYFGAPGGQSKDQYGRSIRPNMITQVKAVF